jgi:hypothetical protein
LGRYLILDEIYRDEFAVVHRAYETMTDGRVREVALKRLSPSCQHDPADLSFDSILKTAGFDHPNIVRVCDFARTSETCFIASEYVQGHSLRELMDIADEAPPIHVVLLLLRQLCDAINYFRRSDKAGAGHLNLHPSTLVLSRAGLLKITDRASCFSSLDVAQDDLAAVGALAYELLCRRTAPEQWNEEMSPSTLNSACPASLGTIVKKCLTGGYDDAGEVLNALVRVESESSLHPTNEVVAAWHKSLIAPPVRRAVVPPTDRVATVPGKKAGKAQRSGRQMPRLLSRLNTSAYVKPGDRSAAESLPLPLPPAPRVQFANGTPATGTAPLKQSTIRREAKRLARGSSPAKEVLAPQPVQSRGMALGSLTLAVSSALILLFG